MRGDIKKTKSKGGVKVMKDICICETHEMMK